MRETIGASHPTDRNCHRSRSTNLQKSSWRLLFLLSHLFGFVKNNRPQTGQTPQIKTKQLLTGTLKEPTQGTPPRDRLSTGPMDTLPGGGGGGTREAAAAVSNHPSSSTSFFPAFLPSLPTTKAPSLAPLAAAPAPARVETVSGVFKAQTPLAGMISYGFYFCFFSASDFLFYVVLDGLRANCVCGVIWFPGVPGCMA